MGRRTGTEKGGKRHVFSLPRLIFVSRLMMAVGEYSDHTTRCAPCGLRKIQSVLERAFGVEAVAAVHHRRLNEFVGPQTRVVGISVMDSAGQGFVSRTLTGLLGERGPSATTKKRSGTWKQH